MSEDLSAEHVKKTCKFGEGESACSYIVISSQGVMCAKGTIIEGIIDDRREAGTMSAKGNNCQGRSGSVTMSELRTFQ